MKVQQFRLDGAYKLALDTMAANANSNVVLVFGSRQQLLENSWFSILTKMYPKANVLSASTAGEIYDNDVLEDSLTVTALELQHTPVSAHVVNIRDYSNGLEAGIALGKKIERKKLSLLLLISDGHIVRADDVLKGLYKEIPDSVKVIGGLAADGNRFQMTLVGLNNLPDEGNIAVLAFYGDQVKTGISSFSGWEPFGPIRTITKSEGNKVFDIDNNSVLKLYKDYLGERSQNLPASAMLFPLNLSDQSGASKIIRTTIGVDEKEQSMTFAGDMPVGAKVQLMKYNPSKLIEAASSATELALSQNEAGTPLLSLVISSAGRKMALGPNTAEEIEGIRDIFGDNTVITGFYSYGEITPRTGATISEVHNHTITILSLNETEKPLNRMLQRQLKKHFGSIEKLLPEVKAFSESVNEVYNHYEEDIELNNRALDISSRELTEANDKMQFVAAKQHEALDKLRNSFITLKGSNALNAQQTSDLDNIESLLHLISNEIEIHKTHETDLQKAVETAEKSNRFKSLFIANVSHEIRTQLNAITGFTNLLAKDSTNQESAEFLSIIKASGDLLMHLLNDIIDIAKFEEGKIPIEKTPFHFHEIVNNAVSPFKLKASEKGLYLAVDFDDIPENLIGDYHRFSQVLINLVSNAIKFTEKGGIKVKFSKVENPNISAGTVMLKCSVGDTGIGISDEVKGKLFESFTQADSSISRRFGGSGLGLSISRDLVNLMGGEMGITKTKQPSEGSEFYFTILLEVQKEAVNTGSANMIKNENRNYRFEHPVNILVADDDIINQKLMKKVLGDMNCNVTIAGDGEQALQQLLDKQFDVVLMDVEMPKLNGYEATKIIREQLNSKLPIIGLTAHAEETNRRQGMDAGMNGFIVKPINEELIFKTIYKFTHQD
jgi:signal transduction histidine kinase/ActR/RegA family two-component response regulator